MNFWSSMPYERLRLWFTFRKTLSQSDFITAVQKTCNLWSYAPFVKYYLTTDNIDNWPGPWELIYENTYCDLAKALGIVYTLYLTDHRPDIEIRIYKDHSTKEQYNLVFIDGGKYVLNLLHDEVVNKEHVTKNLSLVRVINTESLKLNQLQ